MAVDRSDLGQPVLLPHPYPNPPPLVGEGRGGVAQQGTSDDGPADIPTYYDLPPLKQSLYGWKVSAYIWVAGIAGSSQILATIGTFTDREAYAGIVRNGRYIALAGSVVGSVLL